MAVNILFTIMTSVSRLSDEYENRYLGVNKWMDGSPGVNWGWLLDVGEVLYYSMCVLNMTEYFYQLFLCNLIIKFYISVIYL